jgi:hypothetical protein
MNFSRLGVTGGSPPESYRRAQVLRRDGRVAEGARLESVFRGNSNVGSNPTLSAIAFVIWHLCRGDITTDIKLEDHEAC